MGKISSSTILTCIGAAGVVVTSVLTAKAVPKAELLLAKAKTEKGEELTKTEMVKAAAPAYIPAVIAGVSTIACIFGANVLNKRYQASIMSAYALIDSSYKEYRDTVEDVCGEDADKQVKAEFIKRRFEEEPFEIEEGEELFFDFNNMCFFNAPMNEVIEKVTMEGGNECYIITTPPEFMY